MAHEEEIIKIHEALDSLSSIAQLDVNSEKLVGVAKNHKFVVSDEDFSYRSVQWLTPETAEEAVENVKQIYKTILEYLKSVYENPEVDWEDPNHRRGLQAIMSLVGEAANKLDKYCDSITTAVEIPKVTESKQYIDLQDFYLKKISKKYEIELEGDEAWIDAYRENEKVLSLDTEKLGLKDFETIRKDKEYELFYIRHEDGHPFFNSAMLRNIKLVCDFDETLNVPTEEDPLLRIRAMQDKDLHGGAQQVLHFCEKEIQEFFKMAVRGKPEEFSQLLNRCVMALMLTSNPKNLIQNTYGKSSLLYFSDFLHFLRQTLKTEGYEKLISYPPEDDDKVSQVCLHLVHFLCEGFFTRRGSIKEEMIGFIYQLVHRGEKIVSSKISKPFTKTMWNQVLEGDDYIRSYLKCYPSGPLFKILDFLREEEELKENIAFDPTQQGNQPHWIYDMQMDGKSTIFIRLPCPTVQYTINKAEVINEFLAFLRSLFIEKGSYLVVNFQNRTSWKEYARSEALENLTTHAEFYRNIHVLTLPKETDFYYQTDLFFDLPNTNDFIKAFFDQIESEKESGFFFGLHIDKKQFIDKMKDLISFIHKNFFDEEKKLVRKQRLDFIELFYHFLFLELVQDLQPKYMSFCCKDGVDISSAVNASFYAFLKLLKKGKLEKNEKDTMLWLYYRAALLIRERSIDSQRLNRTLSCLDFVETKVRDLKKSTLQKRYPILKKLVIKD